MDSDSVEHRSFLSSTLSSDNLRSARKEIVRKNRKENQPLQRDLLKKSLLSEKSF